MAKYPNYSSHLNEGLKNKKIFNDYNPYFTNYTLSLFYQDISNNRTISVNNKEYYLKKSLRESDMLVISIGMEELSNNYHKYDMKKNYDYFNKMYLNIEELNSPFEINKELLFHIAETILNDYYDDIPDFTITFVEPEKIKELNRNFRNVDAVTDVLSFESDGEIDPETGKE